MNNQVSVQAVLAAHGDTLTTDEQRATFERVKALVLRSYTPPAGRELITNPFLARDARRRAVAPIVAAGTISTPAAAKRAR